MEKHFVNLESLKEANIHCKANQIGLLRCLGSVKDCLNNPTIIVWHFGQC